jgi:hypothetical protein
MRFLGRRDVTSVLDRVPRSRLHAADAVGLRSCSMRVARRPGGVVTNRDPAYQDAGIFLCVGDLNSGVAGCVRDGDARAGVQVWLR